ncbi:MAG: ribonuclease H-like domain-containing protein [Dehalococcoidia bacterium]
MAYSCDAYFDIETTGLSCQYAEITVIGMYLVNGAEDRMVQLVGQEVPCDNLLESLKGVDRIYTYNGSRFDLPFIYNSLGIDLATLLNHHDLMYDCWRCYLFGGLKAVEKQLRIPRQLQGISGLDAVRLWWRYLEYGDCDALATLLEYNREDVMNVEVPTERLTICSHFDGRHHGRT